MTDETLGANPPTSWLGPREREGEMIGRYKLLQPIGEGGFGSVWMAEQREPVKRRVALKIIKLGMDTKQVIARFEAERQALAMMDHPNIAKVLDAGSTETGRPFFVMEYIKGVPILEFCDTERLDTRARLMLFTSVCQAIQHAHQKGIIHRDIKPSNVLITLHDGTPVPKVIDFGIAKATTIELTTRTLFTEHRQMIGTPAYMSPEQAEMSGLDIDTRSDIYSLGVVLYELLTGTTPFSDKQLRSAGFAEMQRIIREEEPPKPSTRLSTLGETATKTALQRHADVHKLKSILKGDLDWIVMKCLEKERSRRYETANGLALDIQRHLRDEPVAAGPPSTSYRIQKFIKRNRGRVIAASVLAGALVLGVFGTTGGMMWALREKENAQREKDNAERERESAQRETENAEREKGNAQRAKENADRERENAERELARANEIRKLIGDMLKGVKPEVAQTADTTLMKKILADAVARLSKGEITDELVASGLHAVVAEVYGSLGLMSDAEKHYEMSYEIRKRVLGEEDKETLGTMMNLAGVYKSLERSDEAESMWSKTLEGSRRILGEEHENTLGTTVNLAWLRNSSGRHAEALQLLEPTLPIMRRVLGPGHRFTTEALTSLAYSYELLGRFADAEALYVEALENQKRTIGEDHVETLKTMHRLGDLYARAGRFAEAEPLFRQSIEVRRRVLGEGHPETLFAMDHLAQLYMKTNRFTECEALTKQLLDLNRRVLGEEHDNTVESMVRMGDLYQMQGRTAEAEPFYEKAVEIRRRLFGDDDPRTITVMYILPVVYQHLGRFAESETLALELMKVLPRALGEEHEKTLGNITNLGIAYLEMGRNEDAARMLETNLPVKRRALGIQHPFTSTCMLALAGAYKQLGRRAESVSLMRELRDFGIAAAEKLDADPDFLNSMAWALLTHEFEELRDFPRALGYARRAAAALEAAGRSDLWMCLDTLSLAEHRTGDDAAAIATERRALSLSPPGHPARAEMEQRIAEYEAGAKR